MGRKKIDHAKFVEAFAGNATEAAIAAGAAKSWAPAKGCQLMQDPWVMEQLAAKKKADLARLDLNRLQTKQGLLDLHAKVMGKMADAMDNGEDADEKPHTYYTGLRSAGEVAKILGYYKDGEINVNVNIVDVIAKIEANGRDTGDSEAG